MLDSIQYEFLFLFSTKADLEPEPRAETLTFRLQLRLRPKVPAPCSSGSGSTTLLVTHLTDYHEKVPLMLIIFLIRGGNTVCFIFCFMHVRRI